MHIYIQASRALRNYTVPKKIIISTVFSTKKKNLLYQRGIVFFKKKISVPQVHSMLEYSKYNKFKKKTNTVLPPSTVSTVAHNAYTYHK